MVVPLLAVMTSRQVGRRADAILGNRQPAIDGPRVVQFRQSLQSSQGHGAAGHIFMHIQHGLVRLEVIAAGIEDNALAYQRQGFLLTGLFRLVAQMNDAGIPRGIALGDRQEGAGFFPGKFFLIQELHLPAVFLRQLLGQFPVA